MPKSVRKITRFGNTVKRFLDSKNMSITDLAKEMGVSHSLVSQALREPPQMEDAKRKIAEYLLETYGKDIKP